MTDIKCVVVGDADVGKTRLLHTFNNNGFSEEHIPERLNNFSKRINVDDRHISLELWDIPARQTYEKQRKIDYPGANVFIICFSISSPTSFENIEREWWPEVSQQCPDVPFLLVGTKKDQRENPEVLNELKGQELKPITKCQGKKMARKIGAVKYLECSALKQDEVEKVFKEAVRARFNPKPSCCCMLL